MTSAIDTLVFGYSTATKARVIIYISAVKFPEHAYEQWKRMFYSGYLYCMIVLVCAGMKARLTIL